MRILIATFLTFISTITFAMGDNDVLVAENQDGGKIVLTSKQCPLSGSEGAKFAFTVNKDIAIPGCWFIYNERLFAVWLPKDGQPIKSEYDPEDFNLEKIL